MLTPVLTVIACCVIVLATISFGVQQTLLNTDRWVAVVGPLASDPGVQSSVAQATAATALNALDLEGRTQALPGPLRNLAAPAESSLSTFVTNQTTQFVESPQFDQVWVGANRAIHQGLVDFLRSGDLPTDGAVKVNDGQVEVNLLMLTPALAQRLQQGLPGVITSQLPGDFGYVSIGQVSTLATMQRAVRVLDSLTLLLLVASPVLVVVTLAISPWRRSTTMWLGLGVAIGMLVAGLVLFVGESAVVASLAGQPISVAVHAALTAMLVSIGVGMLVVFVVAVVIALLAGLTAGRQKAFAG
ncbi:MAG: hypothetical protein JO057_07655 [Chloroflexi bacterium]|nr:hypothetical protein [Chloroflexota bacterium]